MKNEKSKQARKMPRQNTDWEAVALAALKHSKKHPHGPDFIAPGYHFPTSAMSLKRRSYLAGKPIARWQISCIRQGKVVKGRGQIVLHYMTKLERQAYGVD